MSRFLQLAVERTLEGRGEELKEYVIGVEVFDRSASFDPRVDPIVRVEARRLRAKLEAYYGSAGKDDEVIVEFPKGRYSPVFRYPWAQAAAAVRAAPRGRDRARRVHYVNPMSGGSAMPLLDCYLMQIDRTETIPFRTTGNAVCHVVEGNGMSRIGEDTIHWGAKDIFSLPHGNWITHLAEADTATMFLVTDRDALRRLDLLKEQYGNDPR